MRKKRSAILSIVGVVALVTLNGATACAASKPDSAASEGLAPLVAPVDFNGFWIHTGSIVERLKVGAFWAEPGPPPALTKWALDYVMEYKAKQNAGEVLRGPGLKCLPMGVPYNMGVITPINFVQTANQLVILNEGRSQPRHIYLDGRPHVPDDEWLPSSNGDSIGRWEGSTLIVDTVGLAEYTHLTLDPIPHGEELHIVERISMSADRNMITIETTMADPKVFTQPYTITRNYVRAPAGTYAMEQPCIVNDDYLEGYNETEDSPSINPGPEGDE